MELSTALEEWHDFYVMLGSSSAALVALLFVAVSVGVGFLTVERENATRTFMSPVVVHFSAILLISAIALAPERYIWLVVGPMIVGALIAFGISVYTTVQVIKADVRVVYFDRFAYGAIPAVVYATIAADALLIAAGWEGSLYLLAASLLVLLFVNIRNAWDLMLSMAQRQGEKQSADES